MEGILIKKFGLILVFSILFLSCSPKTFALSDTSASSVVINADTLEIIYKNNPHERRSMASTTKIMTALLLCESGKLDDIITCSKEAVSVEGSSMGLKAGDKIKGRDLLLGLLLMSGNDAANVCAYYLSGSIEKFAIKMNEKAAEIGLKDTNFVTPSGLDAEKHYTTAYDLACLTAYAIENVDFLDACSKSSATVSFGDPMVKHTITNHNRLLKTYEGCIGVKTGFTKKSGRCLVSAAKREGKTVIAVTLNNSNDWRDHKELLDYGFEKLSDYVFSAKYYDISAPIINSDDNCKLTFDDITVSCLPESYEKMQLKFSKPNYLIAPISKDGAYGTAEIIFEEKVIASTELVAINDIKPKEYKEPSFYEKLKSIFNLMLKTI